MRPFGGVLRLPPGRRQRIRGLSRKGEANVHKEDRFKQHTRSVWRQGYEAYERQPGAEGVSRELVVLYPGHQGQQLAHKIVFTGGDGDEPARAHGLERTRQLYAKQRVSYRAAKYKNCVSSHSQA